MQSEPTVTTQTRDPLQLILNPTIAESTLPAKVAPTQIVAPKTLPPIPESVLGTKGREAVDNALQQLPLESLTLQQVVYLGVDVQRMLGQHIDSLLGQVRRKDAPALFDLFEQLARGIKDANLDELEQRVQKTEQPGWFTAMLESFGWGNPVERLRQANEELKEMLNGKSETLLTLVQRMERQAVDEAQALVLNLGQIDTMGRSYLQAVHGYAVATQVAYELRDRAQAHLDELQRKAAETGDPHDQAHYADFQVLVQQLENRALALRTGYEKIPANLSVLAMAKEAASSTLAETAAGLQQEFIDLKSALLSWHMLLSVQSMQQANQHRRQVAELLQRHGLNVLDRVSTTAATSQGVNRLADAKLLLDISHGLSDIRAKVQGIAQQRDEQFQQAEAALADARDVFSHLPGPSEAHLLTQEEPSSDA